MSKDPIDKWLDAMEFEIFRLSSKHQPGSTELLESRIKQLGTMPVTKETRINLKQKLYQLECLKQDLQSLRVLHISIQKLQQAIAQAREKRSLDRGQEVKVREAFEKGINTFEKSKVEERERQRQHLASLRQLWPKADYARKRRMVGLFATYARRRLMIGTVNSLLVVPIGAVRWLSRMYRRNSGV